jgi:glycopeptide antibiotics resistance protein
MTFLGLTILIYEYMRKASLSIELLQYILAYLGYGRGRATDVDDLILNTLGVMIGYQIFDRILIRLHFLSRSQMHNRLE